MVASGSKAAFTIMRYRPAILALTAIAAGITVYAIQSNLLFSPPPSSDPDPSSKTSLHRSNAQRRRRTFSRRLFEQGSQILNPVDSRQHAQVVYPRFHEGRRVYGCYTDYTDSNRLVGHEVWLAPDQLPTASKIHEEWGVSAEEAAVIRNQMEKLLLISFFAQEMPPAPPIPLTDAAKEDFIYKFAQVGNISPDNVTEAMAKYESGELQHHHSRLGLMEHPDQPRALSLWSPFSDPDPADPAGDLSWAFRAISDPEVLGEEDNETVANTVSDRTYESGEDNENETPQDQDLMNLLYRIAEDQAKKDSFVHRGVNCNSCNILPIRGIRYRCSNCHDYDLCEQCEALQVHDKTHLFYKIRIPAPFLGNHREPTPVWYPGDPRKAAKNLTPELRMTLSQNTSIEDKKVDAYWDQFQCIAASDYPGDLYGFRVAINRRSFNQCFVPNSTKRQPPPNLVYDRMFSFYDTNNDGLIGFEEFLSGIACISELTRGKPQKLFNQRIFRAYDVDGDGFVNRKDFLRMFKGFYALTKELTMQVVSGMDDEFFDEEEARNVIAGSQPLSSIFSGAIPPGQPALDGWGKTLNRNGDHIINDGMGVIREDDAGLPARYDAVPATTNGIITTNTEFRYLGELDPVWHNEVFSQDMVTNTEDSTWPPRWVFPRDVGEALGSERLEGPESVSDPIERCLVLCAVSERANQILWTRGRTRRQAINNRWEARRFYLETDLLLRPGFNYSEDQETSRRINYAATDLSSHRARLMECLIQGGQVEELRRRTRVELLEHWSDKEGQFDTIMATLETYIKEKKKWHDMAKAIAPARTDIPKAAIIVRGYLRNLALAEGLFASRPSSPTSASPDLSPVRRRSRSSSKVSLGHQVDGGNDNPPGVRSRASSSPTGERKSGFRVPQPEPDHGRDIIYRIVQEGMNELLDPVFKLREDLALQVIKTKEQRTLYKTEIDEVLRDGEFAEKIMIILKKFQRKWYKGERDLSPMIDSQAVSFVEVVFRLLKKPDGHFDKYIHILKRRGQVLGQKSQDATDATDATEGSKQEVAHEIREESSLPTTEPDANVSFDLQLQEATDAIVKLEQEVAHEIEEESWRPPTATELVNPSSQANEEDGHAAPEYPELSQTLHEGVSMFNEADSEAVEEVSKQKPLELLLADAGYGVVTPPIPSPMRADGEEGADEEDADPTLPHHRPNAIMEEGVVDPTLPQHRAITILEWELKHNHHFQAPVHPQPTDNQASLDIPSGLPQIDPPANKVKLCKEELEKLALWTVIERDDHKQGGPGRLSLEDFETLMEGNKGRGLGFIGSWIESATF
ncbi:MAG: hypothetical protein L6R37_001863 [Teloschistes peruensis]|nr:MAG: hypothetical protein L6R37_001863 [Teloschistes peruensis]